MSSSYTKFACGHVLESRIAAGRTKKQPEGKVKRRLKRVLSLGMAGEMSPSRTRTIALPAKDRIINNLKRALSFGMSKPPTLESIELCPNCKENRNFQSDRYDGEVNEQSAEDASQDASQLEELAPLRRSSELRREQTRDPLAHIRERTQVRSQILNETNREETLANLEGRRRAPTIPLGGFVEPAEQALEARTRRRFREGEHSSEDVSDEAFGFSDSEEGL